MERSSGLICFHLQSDTPSLVGPATPPVGCSGLLLLHANRPTVSWGTSRGLRPCRFHAVCLSPWNHPHKNAVLSLGHGPGCQVQPGEGSQRLGEEESQESLILQLAPLCWAVVLRPRKPSILLSTPPKKWEHQCSPLHLGTVSGTRKAFHGVKEASEARWLQNIWNLTRLDDNAFSLLSPCEDSLRFSFFFLNAHK